MGKRLRDYPFKFWNKLKEENLALLEIVVFSAFSFGISSYFVQQKKNARVFLASSSFKKT
jgi:hypothetical protein